MLESKKRELAGVYAEFDAQAAPYRREAACGKGCAFCCSDAGSIDITTLEGLVIRERIAALPRPRRLTVEKSLAADRKRRERGQPSTCPLLMKNRACMIYAQRPFACRRIYSLKVCGPDQHPLLSKQVMALGDAAIGRLQALDDSGYSGHLSYILHMLDHPAFLETYLAGRFDPQAVMVFGKRHGIMINRMAAGGAKQSVSG